jgi:PhzF family phenazine biosynthesis protein
VRLRTVDAFADEAFTGNAAAVVVLEEAPSHEWMAALARELNLSETAFLSRETSQEADFRLRWFTPAVEVDLCGHATLAAAHCLFEDGVSGPIRFATRSGVLTVSQRPDGALAMDFPASPPLQIDPPVGITEALGVPAQWTGRTDTNYLLVHLADERTVRDLSPATARVAALDADVVVVTAAADPGQPYDFVSRVFAPNVGIDEDPVTGSAHTVLASYWAERLGRTSLVGFQASARSGLVGVELNGDRVIVSGRAVTVLDGVLSSTAVPPRGSG